MNLEELKVLQFEIAKRVDLRDRYRIEDIKYVIGVDQTFFGEKVVSCAVKFEFPSLIEIERNYSIDEISFPYIPGFLMFREGEPAIRAVKRLISERCVIIVDGSGIAHPRRCGLATYIAIKTETPAIGVTKKKLYGEVHGERFPKAIKDRGETIGYVFKACENCKEIYISPGSFISPETALEVIKICTKNNLPLPIKYAHDFGQKLRQKLLGKSN